MYFTQQEIAQSRDDTLNNLLGISTACLGASQRLSELLANGGRDALSSGSRHLADREGAGKRGSESEEFSACILGHRDGF